MVSDSECFQQEVDLFWPEEGQKGEKNSRFQMNQSIKHKNRMLFC